VKKNILITGMPGTGKTTLIRKILADVAALNPAGFYTEEIREAGVRRGFALISTDGVRSILSHENIRSPFRVGKYGVDLNSFESFIDRIPFRDPDRRLLVIDEIGRMECFSRKFTQLTSELLSSDRRVIATVAMKGTGLIADVKARPDVELIEITRDNRNDLPRHLLQVFSRNVTS